MPDAIRPFRWDLVRPDHLGSLLDGLPEPDLWFLDELTGCAAKVLARSEDGELHFVGRSADSVFDLLGGALPDPGRLHLLPLSTGSMDGWPHDRLHPAEIAQLRANLAAHGLAPDALARGSRPVVFVDVVSSGRSFGQLIGLLRDWAADDRADWAAAVRRIRILGLPRRTHTSPHTRRWQQHAEWTHELPAGAIRNISLESAVFSYFADHQQKLTRSFGRYLWAAEEVREPARDHRTRRALAEAVAIVEAGRTPAVRERLARTMSREPAIAEPWLRDLVRRLLLPASPG
ncbi:hypothetical protein [Amycolatopsis rifamycinica]|uniref:Uncharacterized protein n=1 Tax=Amycolatopsis rifamycinica TaxID=287986 RepID=A0A066TU19_9PSEU|nr:hypothetical protein [Amycolatopsis rifamycinica]KDN17052.1 hypothetical protein DV20_38770 [Amycolatopsis rifamycinica]